MNARGNTVNAGLALRRLNESKTVLYGTNVFYDHDRDIGHNRVSIGADVQTALAGLAANRYWPLSDWKKTGLIWEERASSGWDLELQGRLPSLPSWQANAKAYEWSGSADGTQDDIHGFDVGFEYNPVRALTVTAGYTGEEADKPSLHMGLRLTYRFGEDLMAGFTRTLKLREVTDRVYDKVRRDNTIRVERRRQARSLVTVLESTGGNSARLEDGTVRALGLELPLPVSITMDAAPGSVARLGFYDGGILTMAAGSVVNIAPDLITLVAGTLQYVSGGTIHTINVPGGTVQLLGTDIDVVANGGLTGVRVRDGSVQITGAVSGTALVGVDTLGQINNGVVGNAVLSSADPAYIAQGGQVATTIDWVAKSQTGQKVAPYIDMAPYLLSSTGSQIGDTITIALRFNTPVTVTGGTPQLGITINGNTRTVPLSAGSGTNVLQFAYTLQALDGSGDAVAVTGLTLNGASVTEDGKSAVTALPASTPLSLGAGVSGPSLVMDFANGSYKLNGVNYGSLGAFLTAAGGNFARASIATYFDQNGVIQTAAAGAARMDHDPVTHAAKGILIEEGRTNIQLQSEAFSLNYNPANAVLTANAVLAPDGTMTAEKITTSAPGSLVNFSNLYSAASGTAYVQSVFLNPVTLANGIMTIYVGNQTSTLGRFAAFSHNNGVLAAIDGLSTAIALPNGWYRLIMPYTPSGTITNGGAMVTGGVLANAGAEYWVWGRMVEMGNFATSYIPTAGSTVTRNADQLSVPAGSWFNQTEGSWSTVFAPYAGLPSSPRIIAAQSGAGTFMNITGNQLQAYDGGPAVTAPGTLTALSFAKAAAAYDAATKSVVLAGGAVASAARNAANPLTPTTNIYFGRASPGNQFYSGHMDSIRYYPTRLPDAQLRALTQ